MFILEDTGKGLSLPCMHMNSLYCKLLSDGNHFPQEVLGNNLSLGDDFSIKCISEEMFVMRLNN